MNQLTQELRDALAPADFAVPAKRKLPIRNTPDDAHHTRMAWSQLPRTGGLTASERKEAKDLVLLRAKELGIYSESWDLHQVTFELQAMSLDMPTEEHPNRMPFTGILTRIDEASDKPPGGSDGKRVHIPKEVARVALPTLLGMGVDTTPEFDGHDAQYKIGVITEATIEGNAVHIAGFLYCSDFPEECARIKKETSRLGFSYECKVAISDKNADPWIVDRIIFTGAAILFKDKAAYRTTSLAANAAEELEMSKEILDAIAALGTKLEATAKEVTELKAGRGASLAGPIIDQAMPHVGACNAAADAMEAAGIGTHPTHGHAAVLRRVGAHILHAASMGKLPHIYRDHSYLGHDGLEAGESPQAKEAREKSEASLKAALDSIEALKTQIADLKAAAAKVTETGSGAPARKTSQGAQVLLDKFGLKPNEDGSLSVSAVDKTLEAAGVKGSRAIEAKMKLQREGIQITA